MLRIDAFAILLIVAAPSPVAAAESAPSPIDRATAARNVGDFATAITLLEAENNAHPGDATVLRLLGTSYAFAGRYDEAIATLREGRAIAPTDQDIALALARAYLWAGRISEASATATEIEAADPRHVELAPLRASIAAWRRDARSHGGRPTLSLSQSIVDVAFDRGGGATWYDSSIALALPVSSRATLTASFDRESRQGVIDTSVALRADVRLGGSSSGYIAATATPEADFRERWGVRTGGEARLHPNISGTLDLRYLDYAEARVWAIEPGFRLHTRDERWSFAIKSIHLWNDGHRSGWSARGHLDAGGGLRFFLGGATYPDTEAGITRRTRSAFAGAIIDLAEHVTLRATYEHDRRAQSYTRNAAILSASIRF